MGCACEYDGDYDNPAFHTEETRRARKRHRCDECGAAIMPGQMYTVGKGMFDGDFYANKTCAGCQNVRDVVCNCAPVGDLWQSQHDESLRMEVQEGGALCLDGLSPEGAAKLSDMIFAHGWWDEEGCR